MSTRRFVNSPSRRTRHGYVMESLERRQLLSASLDTTFNGTGFNAVVNGGHDVVHSVYAYPNGQVLAAGVGKGVSFGVTRYTSAGVIDTTFGTNGQGEVTEYARIQKILVAATGKIILVGDDDDTGDLRLTQLTAEGKLDTTFGTNGVTTLSMAPDINEYVTGATLDANGRVVVVGFARTGNIVSGSWFAYLARFNSQGNLDSSFNSTGKRVFEYGSPDSNSEHLEDVIILGDRIIVGGSVQVNGQTTTRPILAAFTPSGSVDSGFYEDGVKFLVPTSEYDRVTVLEPGSDGFYAKSGTSIYSLSRNGNTQLGFGNGSGRITPAMSINDLMVRTDGRIIAVGSRESEIAVAQFAPDGTADSSFGANGVFSFPIDAYPVEFANAASLAGDDRLYLGGRVFGAGDRMGTVVARLRIEPGDPFVNSAKKVVLNGTDANDSFSIERKADSTGIRVRTQTGEFTFGFGTFSGIDVNARGGDDTLALGPDLGLSQTAGVLYNPGAGDRDTLSIFGTNGNDASPIILSQRISYAGTGVSLTDDAVELVKLIGAGGNDVFYETGTADPNAHYAVELDGGSGEDFFFFNDAPFHVATVQGGEGNDGFLYIASQGADEISVSTDRISTVAQGRAPAVHPFSGIENLEIQGYTLGDVFNVVPLATTALVLKGGSNFESTDTLNFDAQGKAVMRGAGTFTVAGAQPITYSEFEAVNVLNEGAATPVTLRATADAYVRDGSYAGQNFGSGAELQLKKSSGVGSSREFYLKFDLSNVSSVANAKLRLNAKIDHATQSPQVALYPIANTSWGEGTINWNNRPQLPAGVAALASQIVKGSAVKYYEFDVTTYLAAEKAAGRNAVTLLVRSLTATDPYLIFTSDEASANRPELVVTPNGGTPPVTPQEFVISPGNVEVPEGSKSSFGVRLGTLPTGNVNVTIARTAGDTDLSVVAPTTIMFTPSNWNVNQNMFIAAADDADATNSSATFTISSSGVVSKTVTATEADNDVVTPPTGGTVTIRSISDSYVRDGSYATQNFGTATQLVVKNHPYSGNTRESYLRFTLGDITSNVTGAKLRVFAKSNSASEAVTLSLAGFTGKSWSETGINWNNKPTGSTLPGTQVVSGTTGNWYEFDVTSTVQLAKNGNATEVTFILKGASQTDAQALIESDETSATANRPQLVATTGTPPPPVQELVVTPAQLSVGEGASASFNVKLAIAPTSNVVVNIARTSGDTDVSTATTSLTFTAANWNITQAVQLAAAQDADTTNGAATFTVSSTGLSSKTIGATEIDDDTPKPTLVLSSLFITAPEGGATTFTAKLSAPPAAGTTLTFDLVKGGVDTDLNITPSTFSFTAADYDKPRTLTLTAAQDADAKHGGAAFMFRSQDQSVLRDFYVQEFDDEDVIATPPAGATVLNPAADAYVRDGSHAATNFGVATPLQVKSEAVGWNRESYLRFNVPSGQSFKSAKLRVFARLDNTTQPSVGFTVYQATGGEFNESTLTWNNKPATAGFVASGVVSGTTGRWYEIDLAPFGSVPSLNTLMIQASGPGGSTILIDSDESSNRPQLVLS
jgi:uncharacterized delta-60 repeat protein